jgi:hypothetical protein
MNRRVTAQLMSLKQREYYPAKVFGGLTFPMQIEPTIYSFASWLIPTYEGGYWEMYRLSNDGFFMSPSSLELSPEGLCGVVSPNGYRGELSPEALGICVCLFSFSHLSFPRQGHSASVQETCSQQYHLLRQYAMEHPEVLKILAVID